MEEIKAYFKSKNCVFTHLKHHFWFLGYDGKQKVIKLGKGHPESNPYRVKLSEQNIPTFIVNSITQARRLIGDHAKKQQTTKLLELLIARGREGVDYDAATDAGVKNLKSTVDALERKGHCIIKSKRLRTDGGSNKMKVFYVYAGKVNNKR